MVRARVTIPVVLLASACAGVGPRVESVPRAAESVPAVNRDSATVFAVADEYFAAYVARDPTLDFPDATNDGLPDNSPESLAAWQALEDGWLARLEQVDEESLWGSPAWALHASLLERLDSSRGLRVCRRPLWRVDPDWGWHIDDALPALARTQPVGTPQARAAALRRWSSFDRFVDTEIENLREGLRQGYTAPTLLVATVMRQVDALAPQEPEQSVFADPARRDTSAEFSARFMDVVEHVILPSLRRYHDFLSEEYLPRARSELAITALPDGLACYRAMVRLPITLPLGENQVDSLGRALLAEATAERDRIARERYGLGGGLALSEAIAADTSLAWSSHAEALSAARSDVSRALALLPRYFAGLPDVPPVVVDTLPTAQAEDAGFGAYYDPAPIDGSGPHRVVVNTEMFSFPGARGTLGPLMLHEGLPGHHLQYLFDQAYAPDHPYSLYLDDGRAAYLEGWATYAAGPLAREMGLFSEEAQLVAVDTRIDDLLWFLLTDGIHVRGWTLEQAIDTIRAYRAGLDDEFARTVVTIVAATPGYTLGYALGEREFVRLRKYAERELGRAFDIRAFHAQALSHGEIPLTALRSSIERWVRSVKAQH